MNGSPKWKKPDEVMALHRLRKKKKALQERMRQPSQSCPNLSDTFAKRAPLDFSRILGGEKRKNPFFKNVDEKGAKISCVENENSVNTDESSDSTLFQLLGLSDKNKKPNNANMPTSFSNILNNLSTARAQSEQQQILQTKNTHLPVDWTVKTKMRLMSRKPFAWNQKLKASEEASGITGFVRCLDTSNSSTLDTSHHARFHQNCLYWQHPVLPGMSLFPRNNGRVSKKNLFASDEDIKSALHHDWTESFRSLFQLVRARQCPYFYMCANAFTCLFQAAGMGGIIEPRVFIAPTTRGLRQTLKQEEIEFTMPLKKRKRKSSDYAVDDGSIIKNSSFDSCYDTMDDNDSKNKESEVEDQDDESEDEMESEEWLHSLGVAADEIKKINHSNIKLKQMQESSIDNSAESLVCVQGVDAQALFNFLLNCKSCIPTTGTFGGIPPTLLAPTAFQGGTLQALKVRESVVHSDDNKYYSVELRGPLLPTTLHSLCSLLQSNENSFSATFANLHHTIPFSKAAKTNTQDEKLKENVLNDVPSVFHEENLSDCGLNSQLLQTFCASEPTSTETIDSFKYCQVQNTYLWS